MAGEWLKFDASTPEKPEVLAITIAMGWDDPDLTVGKLLRVWRWFDQQTVNGNAPRVTSALLDRLVGVSGLCDAMASVGWLVIDGDGLTLPNFDRHNGKTAKDRALTAKRVANHKSNAQGNAAIVSGALPREEKRREEEKSSLSQRAADSDESLRETFEDEERTPEGLICFALRGAGIDQPNPGHPTLKALVAAGAEPGEFLGFAPKAKGKADPFAYLLSCMVDARKNAPSAGSVKGAPKSEWHETRGGVERRAAELGLGKWDECSEWSFYKARVLAAAKEAA